MYSDFVVQPCRRQPCWFINSQAMAATMQLNSSNRECLQTAYLSLDWALQAKPDHDQSVHCGPLAGNHGTLLFSLPCVYAYIIIIRGN